MIAPVPEAFWAGGLSHFRKRQWRALAVLVNSGRKGGLLNVGEAAACFVLKEESPLFAFPVVL